MKAFVGKVRVSSQQTRRAAHITRGGGYLVLLAVPSLLQLSQAVFTCSGGSSSCPDENLQVSGVGVRSAQQLRVGISIVRNAAQEISVQVLPFG